MTREARAAVAAVLACAVVAAGCSWNDAGGPGSAPRTSAISTMTAASSTSPTPSPTPTVWALAVAQQKYLGFVKPGNAALDAYDKLSDRPKLKTLRRACKAVATADSELARNLAAGLWPAEAVSPINKFIDGLTKERSSWLSCANSDNVDDAYSATRSLYDASPLAERVRIALRLPSAD